MSPARRFASGSLFQQLVAFALSLVSVTALILGSLFFVHARQQARRELVGRGRLLADTLALNVRRGVETANVFRTVEPLLEAALLQPDVSELRVLDSRGELLARAGRAGDAETIELKADVRSDEDLLIGPERTGRARPIGRVEVGMSLAAFHARLGRAMALFVAVTVGIVAFGSVLALAFGRRITTPLERLVDASSRIRRGQYGVVVPAGSRDELGALAEAFSAMSRELAETAGCLEQVVESLLTAVVVVGADGRIRRVNRAACGMTGFEPAELAGRPLSVLFPQGPGPLPAPTMDQLLREGTAREQSTLRMRAGGRLPVSLTASLVKDADGLPCAVVILADAGMGAG